MTTGHASHSRNKGFGLLMTAMVVSTLFVLASCNFITLTTATVVYNGNGSTGGSVPVDSMAYLSGMNVTVLGNTGSLVRSGFSFGGWNASSDGTGTNRIPGTIFAMGPTNLTLYAKWISEGIEMIAVPGGSFEMGSIDGVGESDEYPLHPVTLAGFLMGKTEVTQAQYQQVTGINPSYDQGAADTSQQPVEFVTWYDAAEFGNLLSQIEGLQPVYTIANRVPLSGYPITSATVTTDLTKNGYRLPTEEEWEYAARGGDGSPGGYVYSGSNNVDAVAWHWAVSAGVAHPVALLAPNALGLFDMSGNVWEWNDVWYESYNPNAMIPPTGMRVYRGGSWIDVPFDTRSATRSGAAPNIRGSNIGFRLARNL